ncbi:ion channel [Brevibacillus sp. B_LB10_24]|uniref:ion channel n=1 Tax=Brevibacillus sp. B_LB10_24 TaxID=3380645 RepID=UPI0038BA1C22
MAAKRKNLYILLYNLIALVLLYFNIILFFSCIYFVLEIWGLGYLKDHFSPQSETRHWYSGLTRTMYFSGMTLAAGGYGDITPFGLSRLVAVIESIIGLILPIALVVNYILFPSRNLRLLGSLLKDR